MNPLSVDPQEIVEQRAKGWPGFHPEDFCHRCGQRNVQAWHADSREWNRVEPVGATILCPQCFTELWTEVTGIKACWALVLAESGDLRRAGWQPPAVDTP